MNPLQTLVLGLVCVSGIVTVCAVVHPAPFIRDGVLEVVEAIGAFVRFIRNRG